MNILVLTPIYPGPGIGKNFTKVVHYFVKEWMNIGENIQVIHLPSYFPKIIYNVPKCASDFLFKKLGFELPKIRISKIEALEVENVPVYRIPLYRLHPWSVVSESYRSKAVECIVKYLEGKNFKPDLIVAHWFDPQLYFIDALKKRYNCKASMVVHDRPFKYAKYINAPDVWGYRKVSTPKEFEKLFPSVKFSFRCMSGIPSYYLDNIPERNWDSIKNFIYVGTLIKRKYADTVLYSLMNSNIKNFKFNIIGEGPLHEKINGIIKNNGLTSTVNLLGRIDRSAIISYLDQSDIFVMISSEEVFGLVYIEAMARGCIVIASKKEGMEGIIHHGENGFLVTAGDEQELTEMINHINKMSAKERGIISKRAIETAKGMTDYKVAYEYLNMVKSAIYE